MKLTFGLLEQKRQDVGRILGYRALQTEEQEEAIYLMQRRKNVRTILIMSFVLTALVVPMVLAGRYLGIYNMNLYETGSYLLGTVVMLGSFGYWSTVVIRERWSHLYQPFYLGFWGSVYGGLAYLACRTENANVSLVVYLFIVLLLGGVPYVTQKERMLFATGLVVLGAVITWRQNLMWQEVGCMVSWGCLGLWLSRVRYSGYIRDCRQRRELKNALLDAETDAMTGLLNCRGLERSLYDMVPHCVRNRLSVAVLMLDIDNFKSYNDTFGHLMGDMCIQQVASELQRATRRRTDVAARVGGEEFLIFLTGLSQEAAVEWAVRLEESIERLAIAHSPENFTDRVTVSIGVQCATLRRGEDFRALRRLADRELYNAKDHGRACISVNGSCYRSKKMESEYGRNQSLLRRRA